VDSNPGNETHLILSLRWIADVLAENNLIRNVALRDATFLRYLQRFVTVLFSADCATAETVLDLLLEQFALVQNDAFRSQAVPNGTMSSRAERVQSLDHGELVCKSQ
jgi:hypothetical protein